MDDRIIPAAALHLATRRPRRVGLLTMLLMALTFALLGCSQASEEEFDAYSIGITTQGQDVSVDAVHMDNRWGVPGGVSISGYWGEASGGASVFNKPMPREISINWLDKDKKIRYQATVKLVDDMAKRARALPVVRYDLDQRELKRIYLIIGLAPQGKAVVWLSNAPYAEGISGRVLEVVGEAQGTETTEVAPYYPERPTR